jgi:Uma2 family endonuclease
MDLLVGHIYESRLAAALIYFIERFLDDNDLGIVLAPGGTVEIMPQLVRAADVAFLRWEQFPGRELPDQPVPEVVPDLAVEILSSSNTEREMERKTSEYFAAGVKQVWLIDPDTRTARVYSAVDLCNKISRDGALNGGSILPGFQLTLEALFDRAGRRAKDR